LWDLGLKVRELGLILVEFGVMGLCLRGGGHCTLRKIPGPGSPGWRLGELLTFLSLSLELNRQTTMEAEPRDGQAEFSGSRELDMEAIELE
jgi:hypothetical protein